MKNENFIILPGWAINHLQLTPVQLIVYGYIYGYTQNGKQWYKGSYSDISNELKSLSKSTVIRSLDFLIKNEYIEKLKDGKENKYRAKNYRNLPIFNVVNLTTIDDPTVVNLTTLPLSNWKPDHLSNINNNILGIFPKKYLQNLAVNEKRFIEILFDEIWIDQNLKRQLLTENLYKDFNKEVLPVLANFCQNKIGAGDVSGTQGRIRTGALGYLRAVLKNKSKATELADASEPKYKILK
jgi:Fe2+ or Zn2+ uptake regulation protein